MMRSLVANALNKQSRVADKGWSFDFWLSGGQRFFTLRANMFQDVRKSPCLRQNFANRMRISVIHSSARYPYYYSHMSTET